MLTCKTNNSTTVLATIYSIKYSFKAGYKYKISVFLKGAKDLADGLFPNVGLKISSSNGGTDAGTDCVGPSPYALSDASSFAQGTSGSSYAWATLVDGTISQGGDYLLVGAFPTANTTKSASVWVRKIEITEIAPPVSFTLTPSTLNIQCGSTSAQNFTVTNVYNTTGVTDYSWNLGANNGWLYNGSAAPSTPISTGTNNSITLTPVCSATQSNVSATITAGGNTYNTNTSAVNVTTPSLSITGDNTICSGTATYSIANLPCDASVTWSASPSGIVSLSCTSCASTTVTKTGSGAVTLTATVSTACSGVQSPISTSIAVGEPDFQFQVFPSYSPDCYIPYEYYDFYIEPTTAQQQTISNYIWGYRDLSTNTTTITQPYGGMAEAIVFPYEGSFEVFVQPDNGCGTGPESTFPVYVVESCTGFNALVAPNPAQNEAFVTITGQNREVKSLPASTDVTMVLYEVNSTQKIRQWKFKNDKNKYQINVRGLRKGVYTLVITVGKYKQSKQLLITE